MKLGLFAVLFQALSLDELLKELKKYPALTAIELGTGNYPGACHLDVDALLASTKRAQEFSAQIADAGLSISAFWCHDNPLHLKMAIAAHDDEILRKSIRLAESLEVPVVNTFSECPGGAPDNTTPNWVTVAWPPEYAETLEWQWTERVIPYWMDMAAFAASHGVKIALEAHPGFVEAS